MNNREKRDRYKRLKNIFGVLAFGTWGVWMINLISINTITSREFIIPIFILFATFSILHSYYYSNYRKLNAGIVGEEITENILAQLGDEYEVLHNVNIEYENKKSEIDSLILSHKGIVIVEAKNYTGELHGDENDQELTYLKISKKGNPYSSSIRNPIKQVKRETYILKEFLKSHHIHKYIDSYVFLAGGQSYVNTDRIICRGNQLIETIYKCGKDNSLTTQEIKKIKQLLLQNKIG